MAGLALAEVSLRDADTGLNITIFDVDPTSYDPFNVPIRGSSHVALDGTVTHQSFGLQQKDFTIQVAGNLTDPDTLRALWTKYLSTGAEYEWRDFYGNRFRVIFQVGANSFHPVPIIGSVNTFTFTLSLSVLNVVEWFSGGYG